MKKSSENDDGTALNLVHFLHPMHMIVTYDNRVQNIHQTQNHETLNHVNNLKHLPEE